MSDHFVFELADGNSISINKDITTPSSFLSTMIECYDGEPLSIPKVSYGVMLDIIQFLTHYVFDPMPQIPQPITSHNMSTMVGDWYSDFIDRKPDDLYPLLNAASFLDIPPIKSLCQAKIATLIKGRDLSFVQETFGPCHNLSKFDIDAIDVKYPFIKY